MAEEAPGGGPGGGVAGDDMSFLRAGRGVAGEETGSVAEEEPYFMYLSISLSEDSFIVTGRSPISCIYCAGLPIN